MLRRLTLVQFTRFFVSDVHCARKGLTLVHQNHSCQPNCVAVQVHINEPDVYKPRLAFFTLKSITAGTELTCAYFQLVSGNLFFQAIQSDH